MKCLESVAWVKHNGCFSRLKRLKRRLGQRGGGGLGCFFWRRELEICRSNRQRFPLFIRQIPQKETVTVISPNSAAHHHHQPPRAMWESTEEGEREREEKKKTNSRSGLVKAAAAFASCCAPDFHAARVVVAALSLHLDVALVTATGACWFKLGWDKSARTEQSDLNQAVTCTYGIVCEI